MSDPHAAATPPLDDEPRTPTWLPVLGVVLFLLVGLAWALNSKSSGPTAQEAAASASGSSSAHPSPGASAAKR
jgi:hypothetical protein